MTAKGHMVLASALAYIPVTYILNTYTYKEAFLSYIVIIFGSLLPDIDEPESYIGHKAVFIAYFLKVLGLKHRTLTHWLITPLLISLIGCFVENELLSLILFSLAIGILAHDIGDMLTRGGIYGFLFPFFPRTQIALLPKVLRFETFSLTEMFFVATLMGVNVYLYAKISI